MKNIVAVSFLALIGTNAFSRITVFSNQDAVLKVLNSEQLKKLKSANEDLKTMDFTSVTVGRKFDENGLASQDFKLSFSYGKIGIAIPAVCKFTALVKSEIVKSNVGGGAIITSSQLTEPTFSDPECVQ